jgi:hypothetical protein
MADHIFKPVLCNYGFYENEFFLCRQYYLFHVLSCFLRLIKKSINSTIRVRNILPIISSSLYLFLDLLVLGQQKDLSIDNRQVLRFKLLIPYVNSY